ncbi:Uncharacterised protein [Mycobacterium tuberculosis]|nr:Uncharacterised protein [Mycobacterium tuberculosis]
MMLVYGLPHLRSSMRKVLRIIGMVLPLISRLTTIFISYLETLQKI